jgi:hypothetical protein
MIMMTHAVEGALDAQELQVRLSKVLKSLIRMRSVADPNAMRSGTICTELRMSPPTLKKLLSGDPGKVEHLFALTQYLSVSNRDIFEIAESYSSKEDLAYQVSLLVQRRFMTYSQVAHAVQQTA